MTNNSHAKNNDTTGKLKERKKQRLDSRQVDQMVKLH